jgi:hypothetical protein
MMRWNLCIGFVLLVTCGCGPARLNQTYEPFEVAPTEAKDKLVGPDKHAQTVKIRATSSGGKMSIYCFFEKNSASIEKEILAKKTGGNLLAREEDKESVNLEVPLPAGDVLVIRTMAATAKKTTVSMKLTN